MPRERAVTSFPLAIWYAIRIYAAPKDNKGWEDISFFGPPRAEPGTRFYAIFFSNRLDKFSPGSIIYYTGL